DYRKRRVAEPTTNSESRPAADAPSVCVVILNYNGRRLLGQFLPLIAKTDYQPLELVVVDNASADDSCGRLCAHRPQAMLLCLTKNLAWAGGNNVGIRYALEKGHDSVILACNDIEPPPLRIRRATESATAHLEFGVIAAKPVNGHLDLEDDMVEKRTPDQALGNLAMGDRYILPPRILDLVRTTPDKNGDIQLNRQM
ncbi:MAG: glycosyltransferase, partial [Verrucomicrobia bacterium]|nr:glycosyltransferase [Verrucomicrobiota bacterium]